MLKLWTRQRVDRLKAHKLISYNLSENLSSIAAKYGTTWQDLARINALSNPSIIYAGQTLVSQVAPICSQIKLLCAEYGDTLSSIAEQFGTTVERLVSANGISNPDYIYAGQVLKF